MKTILHYVAKKIPVEQQTDMISVVVPIYNIKPYLSRSIDSILRQTYQNLEIILVDDGSTDGSSEICDRYAKKDARIKVKHKENKGAGSARNKGMEIATGKYLTFVDGDDWIEREMYESMIGAIWETNAQLAVCRSKHIFSKQVMDGSTGTASIFEDAEMLEMYIKSNAGWTDGKFLIEHGVCNKLYERSLVNGLLFSSDLCGEEVRFITSLLSRVQKGIYLDTAYYNYVRNRLDSLTNLQFSLELFDKDLCIRNDKSDFLRKIKRDDLADINDFFLYDHLLSAYLEWDRSLSRREVQMLRLKIKKLIHNRRLQIEKIYNLPIIGIRKKNRMQLFFLSPHLFLIISNIRNFFIS